MSGNLNDINQFSTIDANNTNIEGIDTAPGWEPSNVGPAFRALMGRLARVCQGLAPWTAVNVSGAAATVRAVQLQTGGVARWQFDANATAEAGSNAGSDFELWSYTDAGAQLTKVMSITRSTGVTTFSNLALGATTFTGAVTLGSNSITGSDFVITGGSVNATTIGATTPAAGTFTTLTVTTSLGLSAPLAIASGGTGQTTAAAALTALGGAPLAGSAGQVFNVATAITATEAVPLAQVGAPNRVQVFVSNGSWTAPAGVTSALVTAVGGGGGGGGGGPNDSGGGGGGSGAVVYRQQVSVVPGTPYTVTIGTAGTGGAAAAAGTAGTATSLGALVTAAGGGGGALGVTNTVVSGGAAGGAGGAAGGVGSGNSAVSIGGMGGGNPFGAGGAGGVVQSTLAIGQNAGGFGAGGGAGSATAVGGNGAPGLLIVEF